MVPPIRKQTLYSPPNMKTLTLSSLIEPTLKDGKKRLDWSASSRLLETATWKGIAATRSEDITISLDGFDWLYGDGLTWMLLALDYLRQNQNALWLELPSDKRQLSYLKESRFISVAAEICSFSNVFDLEDTRPSRPSDLTFHSITMESLVPVLRGLNHFLRMGPFGRMVNAGHAGYVDMELIPAFATAISETAKNVVQHSQTIEGTGFGYLSVARVQQNLFRISVGDVGRGFRASLANKGVSVASDSEAIREALLYRYHAKKGEGLFRVAQFLSHQEGVIRMRSNGGDGFLKLPKRYVTDDEEVKEQIISNLSLYDRTTAFPGVQLMIDVYAND